MKRFKIQFEYWEDNYTKRIRKRVGNKEADDREYYFFKRCVRKSDKWNHSYFLPPLGAKHMRMDGEFTGKYADCEKLVDSHRGETAYIFCPGPSLAGISMARFSNKVTIAVNSAAFRVKTLYWTVAESSYADWLVRRSFPWGQCMLLTARAAVRIRHEELDRKTSLVVGGFILRWEEELIIPCRSPGGASIMNALVSAWQMGCPRAFVYGLDLCKENGPYVDGVPYTRDGARRSFEEQIRTLNQFRLPDFEVYNCSPVNLIESFKDGYGKVDE